MYGNPPSGELSRRAPYGLDNSAAGFSPLAFVTEQEIARLTRGALPRLSRGKQDPLIDAQDDASSFCASLTPRDTIR